MWNIIYNNFKNVLESTELTIPLKENPNELDLNQAPNTIFNGCYTLEFGGINNWNMASPNVVDYEVDVNLHIGYVLNINNMVNEYIVMNNDIMNLITRRMNANTFINELIEVRLKSCPMPKVDTNGIYYVWEIIFTVVCRMYMFN